MILVVDIQKKFLSKNQVPPEYEAKINNFLLTTTEDFAIVYDTSTDNGEDLDCLFPTLTERAPVFISKKHYNFILKEWKNYSDDIILKIGRFIVKNKILSKNERYFDLQALTLPAHKEKIEDFKNLSSEASQWIEKDFKIPTSLIKDFSTLKGQDIQLIGGEKDVCLREIKLVLQILEVKTTILPELTY